MNPRKSDPELEVISTPGEPEPEPTAEEPTVEVPPPHPGPSPGHGQIRIPLRPGSGPVVIGKTSPGPRTPVVAPPVEKADRAGPVTGAKIILLVQRRPMSSGNLASRLQMEESYIRRVCRTLVEAGILRAEIKPQRGTRPLRVYSLSTSSVAMSTPVTPIAPPKKP